MAAPGSRGAPRAPTGQGGANSLRAARSGDRWRRHRGRSATRPNGAGRREQPPRPDRSDPVADACPRTRSPVYQYLI